MFLKKIFNTAKNQLLIDIFLFTLAIFLGFFLFFNGNSNQTKNQTSNLTFVYHQSAEIELYDEFENFIKENDLDKKLDSSQLELLFQKFIEYKVGETEKKADNKVVIKKDCKLPRGGNIKNGEFVFAYKQRIDSPDICDVEKRYCINGKLLGTFAQKSCSENFVDDYEILPFKVYNLPKIDPLIQPENLPDNWNKNYDINGKPLKYSSPNTIYRSPAYEIYQEKNVGLEKNKIKYCTSPRGEKIKEGEFVKAYLRPYGSPDLPCEVQLRYCINGKLLGDFVYSNCKVIEDN